jgi:CelD/BcsL family acetyltransferase involved in cellulose biosynthesis
VVEEQVLAHSPKVSGAGAEVEVIRSPDRFNAIGPEWDRLVDSCGIDRMFVSHTWFRTWWECFGADNDLHIVTVRSRGELVAVAPMMRTRASIYGFKAETLHAIYNPHTPRFDFVVAANQDPQVYEHIWHAIVATPCEAIILAQVQEGSGTIQAIDKLAKSDGWLTGQWVAPVSPFVSLGCDFETYYNNLRSGVRFNLKKRYERLRKLGPVDVEVVTEADAVDQAMRDGFRIEAAAWKGQQGTAMLSNAAVAEFYLSLAKREAALKRLRLTFLRVGGKRIAFNYLLQNRNKLYAVKIGYDPEYHAYSPGNMLLNLILKDAFGNGIQEYDLLGGDDAWKFEWTEKTREHRWLFLFRSRLRPRLLHHLKFGVVPAVKHVTGRK